MIHSKIIDLAPCVQSKGVMGAIKRYQQSKLYSKQLPTSAIQGMEVTTGTPTAEYGDKTSLIDNITTRSGLGAGRVFGNVDARYGSFGEAGGDVALGYGTAKFGEFLTVDGTRTGRFLDTPEFTAFHDKSNNASIFGSRRLCATPSVQRTSRFHDLLDAGGEQEENPFLNPVAQGASKPGGF